MKLADFISVSPFPAVVQAHQVAQLRLDIQGPGTAQFLASYLALDSHSRHAATECLASLHPAAGPGGKAFWLNGVFGCGKSHLLGLLALLACGAPAQPFAASNPDLTPLLGNWPDRLVVHFSLDNYDARSLGLEEIFWREVRAQWERQGLGAREMEIQGARQEALDALLQAARAQGLGGLVLCVDELSLFLAGRSHAALQRDAAFLQFLGQSSVHRPVWVFAALQKTLEDVGGIENYSLHQIRDRYTLLTLSLADLEEVVSRRLVRPLDAGRLDGFCREQYENATRVLGRLDYGPEEWRKVFPFHPATLRVLQGVVGRFFSRTRSAMLFCEGALQEATDRPAPAPERVPVDVVFDYFEPELHTHPELRSLSALWNDWQEALPFIAGSDRDHLPLLRVMKCLMLWHLAGWTATPLHVANALNMDGGLGPEGNYELVRHLLDRLARRGAGVLAEGEEDPLTGRYSLDLGQRVTELARRHVRAGAAALAPRDARITLQVLSSCCQEPLPLAPALQGPTECSLFWHNSPRRLLLEVWQGGEVGALANRVATAAEPGAPYEAVVLVVPPFWPQSHDRDGLLAQLASEWRTRLWVWSAREPLQDEWEMAAEATAAALLEGDPLLRDNRRGRAVLEHLRKDEPARAARLVQLAARLLREGEISTPAGLYSEAAEVVRGDNLAAMLESIGNFCFEQIYPEYPAFAPTARVLTASNAESLCLELLRVPRHIGHFSPAPERIGRQLAEPLGVAQYHGGRLEMGAGDPKLARALLSRVQGETTLRNALQPLLSPPFGLKEEQAHLLVCALLRQGHLVALRPGGEEWNTATIGLPLQRSVAALRAGQLLDVASWDVVISLTQELTGVKAGKRDFPEQERLGLVWTQWREQALAEANLARARVAQLRRQLGHGENQWLRWEGACRELAAFLEAIPADGTGHRLLQGLAQVESGPVRLAWKHFQEVCRRLEERQGALVRGLALLKDPQLVVEGELRENRERLLLQADSGEEILEDDGLLATLSEFQQAYLTQYREWHATQHHPDRWHSLRRLAHGEHLRQLDRLATLVRRDFPQAEKLRSLLEDAVGRACCRDGLLDPGQVFCPECRLALGERIALPDARALERESSSAYAQLLALLQESPVRSYLERHASPWLQWEGDAETLEPLLVPALLRQLDEALKGRRRVGRSLEQLKTQLQSAPDVQAWENAWQQWLHEGGRLEGGDEVYLEEAPAPAA